MITKRTAQYDKYINHNELKLNIYLWSIQTSTKMSDFSIWDIHPLPIWHCTWWVSLVCDFASHFNILFVSSAFCTIFFLKSSYIFGCMASDEIVAFETCTVHRNLQYYCKWIFIFVWNMCMQITLVAMSIG